MYLFYLISIWASFSSHSKDGWDLPRSLGCRTMCWILISVTAQQRAGWFNMSFANMIHHFITEEKTQTFKLLIPSLCFLTPMSGQHLPMTCTECNTKFYGKMDWVTGWNGPRNLGGLWTPAHHKPFICIIFQLCFIIAPALQINSLTAMNFTFDWDQLEI